MTDYGCTCEGCVISRAEAAIDAINESCNMFDLADGDSDAIDAAADKQHDALWESASALRDLLEYEHRVGYARVNCGGTPMDDDDRPLTVDFSDIN